MEGQTLVLDQSYQPVAIVPWQRAVTLWFEDKVEVVEEYAERIIHMGQRILMPMIVRFVYPAKQRKRAVKFSRDSIYLRDRGECQYCGCKVARSDITYDHVVPRTKGGKTNFTNIVTCCKACNQCKGQHMTSCGRAKCAKCKGMRRPMVPRNTPVKPKSLPPRLDRRLLWRPNMPGAWAVFMTKDERASHEYWHGVLDED